MKKCNGLRYEQSVMPLLVFLLFLSACAQKRNISAPPQVIDYAPHPKNIILMIGDGMGLAQLSAAIYDSKNKHPLEEFPVIGLHKSFATSDLITDSGAGATAFACGIKTYRNAIGMDQDTLPCRSIIEEAEAQGLATGLVATSSIVHATPASFIAHQPMRTFYEDIAADFLKTDIDLLIGGGLRYFNRRTEDTRDLYQELEAKGYYVNNYFNADLTSIRRLDPTRQVAFFTADNQPISAMQGRDYLPTATRLSLRYLESRSNEGFFVMIEGSQIDWHGHSNEPTELLAELEDFGKAIEEALEFVRNNRETLLIVTGDHETGGLAINPGSKMRKLNLQFTTNGHTACLVPVYAVGPQAALFAGVYDNTDIYHKMVQAFGWPTDSTAKTPKSGRTRR